MMQFLQESQTQLYSDYPKATSRVLSGSLRGVTDFVCKHDLMFHGCGVVRAAN
jgi:hypothetical protein